MDLRKKIVFNTKSKVWVWYENSNDWYYKPSSKPQVIEQIPVPCWILDQHHYQHMTKQQDAISQYLKEQSWI